MLARARGLDASRLLKLAQVQTELKASLEEMLALVDEVLHAEAYSREEICQALGVTSEQFSTEVLSSNTQHSEEQYWHVSLSEVINLLLTLMFCGFQKCKKFCCYLLGEPGYAQVIIDAFSSDTFQAAPASQTRVRRSCAGAAVSERVQLRRGWLHTDTGRADEPESRELQRPVRVQLPWTG